MMARKARLARIALAGDGRCSRWRLRFACDRIERGCAGKRNANRLALAGKQKRSAFGNARQVRITVTEANAPPLLELV